MALTQREGTRYQVLLVIGNAAVHERCPFQRLRGMGIKDNNYKKHGVLAGKQYCFSGLTFADPTSVQLVWPFCHWLCPHWKK